MMNRNAAQAIASALDAVKKYDAGVAEIAAGGPNKSLLPLRTEWAGKWRDAIAYICHEFLPSGSGFDNGVTLDLDASKPEKLVFLAPYHAMDSNGSYDGWRDYTVTVRASLVSGLDISVSGRDSGGLRDYVADTMAEALATVRPHTAYYPAAWSEVTSAA
jgi:hypothetical protein